MLTNGYDEYKIIIIGSVYGGTFYYFPSRTALVPCTMQHTWCAGRTFCLTASVLRFEPGRRGGIDACGGDDSGGGGGSGDDDGGSSVRTYICNDIDSTREYYYVIDGPREKVSPGSTTPNAAEGGRLNK